MTITRAVAIAGCVLGLLAGIVFADAKSDFEMLFGKEAKKVLATKSTADDAAFAKKLLTAAKNIADAPKTQVFIYEKVVEFGSKDAGGTPHALEAIDILTRSQPAQKAKWQEAKLNVVEKQYQTSPVANRKEAAKAYLDVLIEAAEAKAAAGKAKEAMKLYRKGAGVAIYAAYKLSEIRDRLRELEAQAECGELIKKLGDDPKDTKTREKLILIYVLERDDPAKAISLLATGVDQNLRECVPLAAKKRADLTEAACMKLGDWYKQLAGKASAKGKPTALAKAKMHYERYLALHTKRDMGRYKVSAALAAIEDALRDTPVTAKVSALLPPNLRRGLVLYYDFDKDGGDKVTDKSGKGNHGKVHGAKWLKNARGIGNAAYEFDHKGGNTYIEIPDAPSLNPKQLTVAVWVMARRGGAIVDKHGQAAKGRVGYILRGPGNGKVNFTFGNARWNEINMSKVQPTSWFHLTSCYDGAEGKIFYNGVIGVKKHVGKPLVPSTFPLRIGHGTYFKENNRRFFGLIDEVMIWDRVLSEEEIKQLYKRYLAQVKSTPQPKTRTIGISFDSPRVAAQSLQRFYTQDPSKWQVAKGKIVGHGPGGILTYKTWFQEITKVTIKGGIVLPSRTNFRVAVGPINLIFNWEGGWQNCYGHAKAKSLTKHKGHALKPGKLHTIVVEQTGEKVIVSVDGKTVYTTKAVLHGTVTVYPYNSNTIGIVEIEITGKPDRNREVRGPSHRLR